MNIYYPNSPFATQSDWEKGMLLKTKMRNAEQHDMRRAKDINFAQSYGCSIVTLVSSIIKSTISEGFDCEPYVRY